MDIEAIMSHQLENDSYVRLSTKYKTYIELSRWINLTLNKPGYNKLELGKDIMKHILEAMENSKHIMENTEMGKKMKELGTE